VPPRLKRPGARKRRTAQSFLERMAADRLKPRGSQVTPPRLPTPLPTNLSAKPRYAPTGHISSFRNVLRSSEAASIKRNVVSIREKRLFTRASPEGGGFLLQSIPSTQEDRTGKGTG